MCGVAAIIGDQPKALALHAGLSALAHRGPDDEGTVFASTWALGQTRLAIIDLDRRSACPMTRGHVTLTYNGELWNWRELRADLEARGRVFETQGDAEVIAVALDEWGETTLPRLEGMFALVWHDARTGITHAARDRFGEVPLHMAAVGAIQLDVRGDVLSEGGFVVSSEIKAIDALGADRRRAAWVEPGTSVSFVRRGRVWAAVVDRWYEPPAEPAPVTLEAAGERMRGLIESAVLERAAASDVPVCTLLSGGIDSTAVAYHLSKVFPDLVAFTAVYNPKSQDARMARVAADAFGIELVEVHVPVPTEADLTDVIRRIEMPYKAQVEIGWPCLWLAREMRERGFKVCFSGEGSDELWASYGFAYHVLQRTFEGRTVFGQPGEVYDLIAERQWCEYRRKLFTDQARKNFPRCNKVFMAHGVECRLPFLHTPLVEWALSVPVDVCVVRQPETGPSKQKAVMYEAYDGLVPAEIVRRHKVAFQEGMGIKQAIADVIDNPRVFYGAEYRREYA